MGDVEARWWRPAPSGAVLCDLCPRHCLIHDGCYGFCSVRRNIGGRLYALSYGRPAAIQIDPIEKKPLKMFLPGTAAFSIGCLGCNMACRFCQNYHLSRGKYPEDRSGDLVEPEALVDSAIKNNCASVAFTYNEPITWAEYMVDIAKIAKSRKLATVMVSNGYVSRAAAEEIFPLIDAANIDMKGFSEDFYKRLTNSSLQPVLDDMKLYHSIGGHLEITNLVIPGCNDDPQMIEAFLDWTAENLSVLVPIHFTAFHPDYKFFSAPPTPKETLLRIKIAAEKKGFRHIFLGNIF